VGGAKGAVAALALQVAKLLELLAEKVFAVDKAESPTLLVLLGTLPFWVCRRLGPPVGGTATSRA